MAGIEINLLQFVALALPAIAILMQAIIMFHQQHSDESTDRIFWTEFRIIEIAFFLMTIGGAVFGIAIFNTATSLITKAGIVLVIGSLILLAPATWFALGRAKYPTTHFESPEEVVSYGVKTMAFILPIIIILLVISFVPRISDSISNLAPIDVPLFQSITLAVSLGAIIITFLTTLEKYYSYRYSSEKTHEWVSDIEEIISSLNSVIDENEELLTTLEIKSESEFRTVRNELREDLRRLSTQLENAPPRVENTAQDVVDRISFIQQRGNELLNLIEETHQLAHSAESRRESLDDVESRLEKVTNEISSVENELDEKYTQREEYEDESEVSDDLENRIRDLEQQLEHLRDERESLIEQKEEIEVSLSEIREEREYNIDEMTELVNSISSTAETVTSRLNQISNQVRRPDRLLSQIFRNISE